MTRETALRILGLEGQADKESILDSYRKLVQLHHPDKNPNDTFIYELNEAKNVLLDDSSEQDTKTLAVIVTNALLKYRETEQKEAEYKNEASLLLAEKVKPRRNKITQLRDLSIFAAFIMAIVGFAITSINGFLDFSYENDNGAIQYSREVLQNDSMIKTINYDSLYLNDSSQKKKVDNYYTNTIKKSEKKRNSMYKFMGLFIIGFGGVLIAQLQMRLKRYDTALEEFKSYIDSRIKLKSLLLDIITQNKLIENRIAEESLKKFIGKYFSDRSLNKSQFESIIESGNRLQIDDVGKIIVLKFLEKKLIEEGDFSNQNIVYNILI